ncbi:MAG: hypothetical protein ACOY4U_08920 [Pseudomonadota bacterium]
MMEFQVSKMPMNLIAPLLAAAAAVAFSLLAQANQWGIAVSSIGSGVVAGLAAYLVSRR